MKDFGQKVNLSKSSIIFSNNVPEQIKADIARQMQMTVASNLGKYLGIPLF